MKAAVELEILFVPETTYRGGSWDLTESHWFQKLCTAFSAILVV